MSSRYRRFDIADRSIFTPPPRITPMLLNPNCFRSSFPMIEDELDNCTALDLLDFSYPNHPYLRRDLDNVMDLSAPTLHHTSSTRRALARRTEPYYMQTLCDRVADLELGFDRLARDRAMVRRQHIGGEKKCTWTAEVGDRKYKLTTEVKKKGLEKSLKWTAKVKGCHGNGYGYRYLSGDSSGSDSEMEGDLYKRKMKKKMCEKLKEKGNYRYKHLY